MIGAHGAPLTTSHPTSLAFHVPTGLEDYALASILSQLSLQLPAALLTTTASLSSSHVLIRFPDEDLLRRAIRMHEEGALWAVHDAFLCVANAPLEGVRPTLEAEFWTRHKEMGRQGREREKQLLKGKDVGAPDSERLGGQGDEQEEHPGKMTVPRTPGEEKFMSSLNTLIASHLPALEAALHIHPPREPSFRVSFSNPSRLVPLSTLHRQGIERELGDTLGSWLMQEKGWSVKLVNPGLDVHVRLVPSSLHWEAHTLGTPAPPPVLHPEPTPTPHFPAELTALLAIALPAAAVPAHRIPPLLGVTPLSPPIAHLLALMHPLLTLSPMASCDASASPILFDPCAGLGSIPREALALAAQRRLGIHVLAGDVHLPSLLTCAASTPQILDALHYNGAQRLPLRPPAAVGGLITDLPWGTRHLSARQVSALYPALLRRLADAVEVGGTGVVMSAAKGAMEGAWRGARGWWEVSGCREIRVGGRAVWVWVVRRV